MKKVLRLFFMLSITIAFLVSCGDISEKKDNLKKNGVPEIRRNELIRNSDFENGYAPWVVVGDAKTDGVGAARTESYVDPNGEESTAVVIEVIDSGQETWSVQFRHSNLTLEQGHTYTISFDVMATANAGVAPQIVTNVPEWTMYWKHSDGWGPISLNANQWQHETYTFTMTKATAEGLEFSFHCGGSHVNNLSGFELWLDNISIFDPEFEGYNDDDSEDSLIRINQVGYFVENTKKATVVSESNEPIEWQLINKNDVVVESGMTTVFGYDADSEENVHQIDFSFFNTPGNYRLRTNIMADTPSVSYEFEIKNSIYSKMKYDALAYFYHNRSGIAIEMPYAGRTDLVRASGPADTSISTWPGSGQASYSKNVSKGWYDAGDHGKYVVNGGIAVWTMLNQYERTLYIDNAARADFSDGSMNIPENSNGIPDILDEAKWEMEFLLNMQVKESEDTTTAGMAHHKMHDSAWTGIPMAPGDNTSTRYLCPVSTAATLNLAATAAQAARLFMEYDATFAGKCLTAAEAAWSAALDHPEIYAPYDNENGGGPYNDEYVLDEFYWAAAELYITTGDLEYLEYIKSSDHFLELNAKQSKGEDVGLYGPFTWGNTAGMATLSLALVPNNLTNTDIQLAKKNIKNASDIWLTNISEQGYRLPIKATSKGYPWGSNSFVLNIMLVMGYAYDYSSDIKYLQGMIDGMNYLLGNNGMDKSYVSGYGEKPLENPHHRFWAHQTSSSYPKAPAGCISGGPNSGLECPVAQSMFSASTPPQKTYVDNIDAWSVNEITINWNAPFAWVSAYLDEKSEVSMYQNKEITISLTTGWNFVSLSVAPEDNAIPFVFSNNIEKIEEIKDNNYFFNTSIPVYLCSLTSMIPGYGYMVKAKEPFEITITGEAVPSGSLNLKKGWNIVGCPWSNSVTVSEFLDSFSVDSSLITSIKDFNQYYEAGNMFSTLTEIEPGKAYQVYVEEDCVMSW